MTQTHSSENRYYKERVLNKLENSLGPAAVFKPNAVTNLISNAHVHLLRNTPCH
jgi:hypothetical protein